MKAPQYQPPPAPAVDPNTAQLATNAATQDQAASQQTAQLDTASIMARYGARLAMAGTSPGSPLAVAPAGIK